MANAKDQTHTATLYKIIDATGDASRMRERSREVSSNLRAAFETQLKSFFDSKIAVQDAGQDEGPWATLIENEETAAAIYHFRTNDNFEFIIALDVQCLDVAVQWAFDRDLGASAAKGAAAAIDRRIAQPLVNVLANSVLAAVTDIVDADSATPDLIAACTDPERLDLSSTEGLWVRSVYSATSSNDCGIGGFSLYLPAAALSARQHSSAENVGMQAVWRDAIAQLAARATVNTRAIIAEKTFDYQYLLDLAPGRTLPLEGAAIDSVSLETDDLNRSFVIAAGKLGGRGGARALEICAAEGNG